MKYLQFMFLLMIFAMMINAQDLKNLIADGTAEIPKKDGLQPTVENLSANEIETVKKVVLEKEVEFKTEHIQMSSEEALFRTDFELLDVAEGFFIYREVEFRAYLYTAYSRKMKRNYQGILVCSLTDNGTKITPKGHYVYEYHGDKYLRELSDINGNFLSELAVFSEPPFKKVFRKLIRIIEFSPNGLKRIGMKEIYSSIPQPQRFPIISDGERPKRTYTPPIISAIKLFNIIDFGKPTEFYQEKWDKYKDTWSLGEKSESRPTELEEDKINYFELIKPVFPKGPGER